MLVEAKYKTPQHSISSLINDLNNQFGF